MNQLKRIVQQARDRYWLLPAECRPSLNQPQNCITLFPGVDLVELARAGKWPLSGAMIAEIRKIKKCVPVRPDTQDPQYTGDLTGMSMPTTEPMKTQGPTGKIYVYEDLTGPVFRVVVSESGGRFYQRAVPEPATPGVVKWEDGAAGIARIPYLVKDILLSDAKMPIMVCGSEAAVEEARKHGFVATFLTLEIFSDVASYNFRGRRVVLVPENRPPSPSVHSQWWMLGALIAHGAASIRYCPLILDKDGEQIPVNGLVDWFAKGGTKHMLVKFIQSTPEYSGIKAPEKKNGDAAG